MEKKILKVFNRKNEGFDIIIGNPPYIQSRNLNKEERHYYWDKYLTDTNHSDIYSFFIERSINLLRNKGILSFIVPITWLQTPSFKSLRKKIFTETKILSVLYFDADIKIFENAQISNIILILQKESDKKSILNNSIKITKYSNNKKFYLFSKIQQRKVNFDQGFNIQINPKIKKILNRISDNSITLTSISRIVGGLRTGNDTKFLKLKTNKKEDRKLLRGRNIDRYQLKWIGEYVWYKPDLMKVKQAAAPKEAKLFEVKEKLLIRMISGGRIISTYDNQKYYLLQDNLILPNKKYGYNIKYILSILNSKLASFFIKNKVSNIAVTQFLLKKFPIHKINFSDKKERIRHNELVKLTNKILSLNKNLQKITEKSDKWYKIKKEIEKIDNIIDKKIYKLYNLTKKEIKIIGKFYEN